MNIQSQKIIPLKIFFYLQMKSNWFFKNTEYLTSPFKITNHKFYSKILFCDTAINSFNYLKLNLSILNLTKFYYSLNFSLDIKFEILQGTIERS